jgi:hypothetical protein
MHHGDGLHKMDAMDAIVSCHGVFFASNHFQERAPPVQEL